MGRSAEICGRSGAMLESAHVPKRMVREHADTKEKAAVQSFPATASPPLLTVFARFLPLARMLEVCFSPFLAIPVLYRPPACRRSFRAIAFSRRTGSENLLLDSTCPPWLSVTANGPFCLMESRYTALRNRRGIKPSAARLIDQEEQQRERRWKPAWWQWVARVRE